MKLTSEKSKANFSAAAEIENICFSDSWGDISVGLTAADNGGVFAVAEIDGMAAGYVIGRVCADESELYRIAVLPQLRGKGIAKALTEEFFRQSVLLGAEKAFLEVRSENIPAIRLYEKCGFTAAGKRKNYYVNPTDDAVIYVRDLNG